MIKLIRQFTYQARLPILGVFIVIAGIVVYSAIHKENASSIEEGPLAFPYSQTEYIITAEPAPEEIGDKKTLWVFNLSTSYQSGWHVRGNKFQDLLKTALSHTGDIYYYYDNKDRCGKAVFLRQEPWDRKENLDQSYIPVFPLKKLPAETSISTIDGREYQIRFSNPKAPRTGTMVGALNGDPGDLRKHCLVRTVCTNSGSFRLSDFEGDEFDAIIDQVLRNPSNRVFEGIFCAIYNHVDELRAYCLYDDPVSQYAFSGRKVVKSLTLNRAQDDLWKITNAIVLQYYLARSHKSSFLKENQGAKIKMFNVSAEKAAGILDW